MTAMQLPRICFGLEGTPATFCCSATVDGVGMRAKMSNRWAIGGCDLGATAGARLDCGSWGLPLSDG